VCSSDLGDDDTGETIEYHSIAVLLA